MMASSLVAEYSIVRTNSTVLAKPRYKILDLIITRRDIFENARSRATYTVK